MSDTRLYYTAPSDEIFEDMRSACIEQWQTHDNQYGYVDEKVDRIKDIRNVSDNFMYMFTMFDMIGQRAVSSRLNEKTRQALIERMKDGGNSSDLIEEII